MMSVYLRAKFEVSSIILTSFRQGGVILPPPPPTSKLIPKRSTQIRVKDNSQRSVFLIFGAGNVPLL